jgi:hypothetical protein
MDELKAILVASRERQERDQKFHAAINGVDLDAQMGKDRFQDIMERVSGTSAEASLNGLEEFGFDVEDLTGGETQ